MVEKKEISVVIPCLNEEKALGKCLNKVLEVFDSNFYDGEIILVDNGSTDNSLSIAKNFSNKDSRIKVFEEPQKGYGNAYLTGFSKAQKEYVFMADADDTYDFYQIPDFLNSLKKQKADFVIGNRFKSNKITKKEMPLLNRILGNPVLTFITKFLFNIKVGDVHCGARLIKKSVYEKLDLISGGMEFASEMVVKASMQDFKIIEIPITYSERVGDSKLNPVRDGWRHLKFLLLNSPIYLFIIPGAVLFILGLFFLLIFSFKNWEMGNYVFYLHPMFIFSLMTIVGYQVIFFGFFAKVYSFTHFKINKDFFEKFFRKFNLEIGLVSSLILFIIPSYIFIKIFLSWTDSHYIDLNQTKLLILALTVMVLSIQSFFSSLMLSILSIKK